MTRLPTLPENLATTAPMTMMRTVMPMTPPRNLGQLQYFLLAMTIALEMGTSWELTTHGFLPSRPGT